LIFTKHDITYDTVMKKHLRPRCPPFGRAKWQRPRHASILWRPCAYHSARTNFTRCCGPQSVTVMNISYQRSLKTEQFITAKISVNALTQGSRTPSVQRQRGSQLQKYKAARMSSRIAFDQKYAAGMDTQGWQLETCKLHKNWECA